MLDFFQDWSLMKVLFKVILVFLLKPSIDWLNKEKNLDQMREEFGFNHKNWGTKKQHSIKLR